MKSVDEIQSLPTPLSASYRPRPDLFHRERWRATQAHSNSLGDLQRAVKYNGPSSPCISGLRSVCWKTFLLSKDKPASWTQVLRDGREDYTRRRESFLRYIKHPEALAELTVDPLADDPDSPWDTARQDEAIRAEIQQDVQRLPDEVSYHDARIQALILDVLFVYCKTNPTRGGYRQGMHELLAPIVHVLEADGIDHATISEAQSRDDTFLELVDSSFVEHDAFLLFSKLMDDAQSFYAVNELTSKGPHEPMASRGREQISSIVERSKFIHEICLQKVDPELAAHLISIEVLPQIFLIRWIRLLFSREFPFEHFLVLWDTIFAVDPALEMIDLICVAMLIRIRWKLLEADYSVCLQLLLKYPPPDEAHGPHTFVDDAVYLRGHLNVSGGATLIMKYTGKMPAVSKSPEPSRPSTPSFRGFNAFRQRGLGARSPLNSPPFMNQQVGVEALFQGAAKGARGMIERGEKLGINQAVRDAMGEIRRNMQGFNESRHSPRSPRAILNDEGAATALVAMERRNQQLAAMLDETVSSLKTISRSHQDEKAKSLELIEIAAAKIQFVKIYLEDSSMEVSSPVPDGERLETDEKAAEGTPNPPGAGPSAEEVQISSLSLTDDDNVKEEKVASTLEPQALDSSSGVAATDPLSAKTASATKPAAVPTRSTIAQSSFSWMLEPNEPSPTQSGVSSKSPPSEHKKRLPNNASRERNAFLFGEVTAKTEGKDPLETDDIFGMERLRKTK